MTTKPLLSIIVPNFNNAVYLDECLESILGQTFRDFEVLVADDGSKDHSPQLIRSWEKRHPDIVLGLLSPFNRGVQGNLHWAIGQSRGQFLTTLDADDYYSDSRKLEREIRVVLKHQKQGEDVIAFSDIALVNEDRTPIGLNSQWAPLREGRILPDLLARICLVPRDFIMPRAAYFEVGGYDPKVLLYEDWDLKLRLSERYPFYYSDSIGTAYRQHGKGISSRPWADHLLWLSRVFEKNLKLADPLSREKIREAFAPFIADITRRCTEAAQGIKKE